MKLTILRGISGSGKSTTAEALRSMGHKVVSRDAIRIGQFGVEFDPAIEGEVSVIEKAMLHAYLKEGYDVVSDNTNIEWKFVKAIAKIGYRYGADVEVKVFDVPLAEAIKRNDKRAALGGRFVDHSVIERQYNRFKSNKNSQLEPVQELKPYSGTSGKPKAFMVDIDGTLAHMRDKRGPFDWKKVGLDDVDETIASIVQGQHRLGLKVIVMSGRDESCREETLEWLTYDAGVWVDELFMRPANDFRPDNLIKIELFDAHVRDNYDVRFVLDDRDQVVEAWRRMGLKCLQVEFGDF
jgi:predicted kinase